MNQPPDIDDRLNTAHDHIEDHPHTETPRETEEVEVPNGLDLGGAVQGVKISSTEEHKEDNNSPLPESIRGDSNPTIPGQTSDGISVHSLPVVHVTEPDVSLPPRPSTGRTGDSPTIVTPPHPSNPLQEDGSLSQQQRRARHRSTAEARSSNRLSGFFTNLIHRRDHPMAPPSRNTTIHEDPLGTNPGQTTDPLSRSSSPTLGRSITPPPQLPPPTLQELGLSLSVLTSDLSPSHFSTPPSSGAFLAPHYLLLCHAQGLDVLPLLSPPSPQPYALVRRVSFKSVVVMEQRGVLVAIAGRRDGVRVYALEEVKKAIEWRIDVEVRRERDRLRRETVKKVLLNGQDHTNDSRDLTEKMRKTSLSTPPPGASTLRHSTLRKGSSGPTSATSQPLPSPPLIPRSPTPRVTIKPKSPQVQIPRQTPEPSGPPPPYSPSEVTHPPHLRRENSVLSFNTRSRSGSISNVLVASHTPAGVRPDTKIEWVESSDDEAIDIVAAGSSGSQALDERTSAQARPSATPLSPTTPIATPIIPSRNPVSSMRRNRPSNLDLTLSRMSTSIPPPEPSPAPTLLTLRQALSHSPPTLREIQTADPDDPDTPFVAAEEDDVDGRISLAQALLESRIPDLPPLGTRRPQQPILITSSHPIATGEDEPSSPRTSDTHTSNRAGDTDIPERRRRRWSVMLGSPTSSNNEMIPSQPSSITPSGGERPSVRFTRSHSFRSSNSPVSTMRATSLNNDTSSTTPSIADAPELPETAPSMASSQSSRSSRFFPRILANAFNNRKSDDRPHLPTPKTTDEGSKKVVGTPLTSHAPPPKLEYVKLPGTKGALMVKAVETAKKSFLAILCGENGEKVELFAGTYRTALGLSRTFILPDSPRSLELQLQGDDLVEVFLVFSQNVFGLEPATVRVREVRIGRAERRAARRRAREVRTGEGPNNDSEVALVDEDTNVNVSIGVSVAVDSTVVTTVGTTDRSHTPPLIPHEHPDAQPETTMPNEGTTTSTITQSEELVTIATANMGSYTTFQQLNFSPRFPLASIADEYIIPPTYPDFLEYRAEYEPEDGNNMDLTRIQFSPPGLPIPVPTAPSKWYYRDPKNMVHGPWKASLMQAWYKDGLLPTDLPVRREEDTAYTLLRDVRLQSVDPNLPFLSPSPASNTSFVTSEVSEKPLLAPISLLSQPRHFGPPALFFSSRGGHSTAIVDARGRSVLKGRFIWSTDEVDEESKPLPLGRMGDIKRLEAFDVDDRAVLVAMRQGGLEAVDLSDALLRPADESRTVLPQFSPPPSNINRRAPFVWKIGTPVSTTATSATVLSSRSKSSYGHHLTSRKQSTGSARSPAGRTEFSQGEVELEVHDEVLFLGRKENEVYFCERNAGSFRILRLCPNTLL
ncbi:hypothetical protein BDZ94DRAFT_1201546 [Collybia nuda]|uniref:GYF domain-containing protein n=1 Tax=Collybia nuda TaxID=64659 RepID=A0A9P6CEQ3_9AGAR|nr:hypothetical protein BDZ94DRAFT_1201546 [Collybia nuda]